MTETKTCVKCRVIAFGIAALFVVFLGSMFYHYQNDKPQFDPEKVNATVVTQARMVPDFKLEDQDAKPISLQQLKNGWSIVFFGFTNCPSMCPTTMAEVAKMMKILELKGEKKLPQVLMVSVDPERDTATVMKKYVKSFDPRFIGVTGMRDQIEILTKAMGVAYVKNAKNESDQNYEIDHSGSLVLVKDGKIVAFFSFPHDAARLAQDYHYIKETL